MELRNNIILYKRIIKDFFVLITFLNNNRENIKFNGKNIDINETTKIYVAIIFLRGDTSKDFLRLFENKDSLTVDKASEILEFYLKLIFKNVCYEIEDYQKELDYESMRKISILFFEMDWIRKIEFAHAIRLFITLVLFLEEDKEIIIKSTNWNIINFLKFPDFWDIDLYNNDHFLKDLNVLKLMNIKINKILSLYNLLGKDIEDNFFNAIKKIIEDENNNEKFSDESDTSD